MRSGYYDNNGTFHPTANLGWLMRHAHDVYRIYIARDAGYGGYLIALLQGKDDRVKTIFFSDFASYEVLTDFVYNARRVWNRGGGIWGDRVDGLTAERVNVFVLVRCDAPYRGGIIRYSGLRWQLEGGYNPVADDKVMHVTPMQNAYNWFIFYNGRFIFRFGGNE